MPAIDPAEFGRYLEWGRRNPDTVSPDRQMIHLAGATLEAEVPGWSRKVIWTQAGETMNLFTRQP